MTKSHFIVHHEHPVVTLRVFKGKHFCPKMWQACSVVFWMNISFEQQTILLRRITYNQLCTPANKLHSEKTVNFRVDSSKIHHVIKFPLIFTIRMLEPHNERICCKVKRQIPTKWSDQLILMPLAAITPVCTSNSTKLRKSNNFDDQHLPKWPYLRVIITEWHEIAFVLMCRVWYNESSLSVMGTTSWGLQLILHEMIPMVIVLIWYLPR